MSHHVNISFKKGLTAKQTGYVYSKCENEIIASTEQVYECEWNCEENTDYKVNPNECAMCNDLELYNVHVESIKIEKWSILRAKVYYTEYNREALPAKRLKFDPTEVRCLKWYRQINGNSRTCQEIIFIM